MPAQITVVITQGPGAGKEFVFAERTMALIGRDAECHILLPKHPEHQVVSRHHCLLDINPPQVCIRDLGSRNGTHVNGQLIGKRPRTQSAKEGAMLRFAEVALQDGDEIKLGRIALRVSVTKPTVCADCEAEIPKDELGKSRLENGEFRCAACRTVPPTPSTVLPPLPGKSSPEQLANHLLEEAKSGQPQLKSLADYRMVSNLGRGAMGTVYLVVHEPTGQRLALKMLLPQVASTPRMREMFLREAAAMKALDHKHLVRLFDLGCSEGSFFFTLEYCEGGSVGNVLKKDGKMTVDKAVPLTCQALEGLEYAHQVALPAVPLAGGGFAPARGLVHRDIKPDNLLLALDGTNQIAKVGDYGLAKAFDLAGLSGLSMTGEAGGTPAFMPRQQLVDFRNARPDVDVWAMAASLYFMLTMQAPREFKKGKDPWHVVLQTNAIPIRRRDAAVPRRLADVIDAALVDDPDIHFKTAAEFRVALEEAM